MIEGGTITTWFEERGFGFVKPDYPTTNPEGETGDVFLHVRQVKSGTPRRVTFEAVMNGRRNRLTAQDAVIQEEE